MKNFTTTAATAAGTTTSCLVAAYVRCDSLVFLFFLFFRLCYLQVIRTWKGRLILNLKSKELILRITTV